MGASLAGLLILGLMLSAAVVMWRVDLVGALLNRSATHDAIQLEGEQARTLLDITATGFDTTDSTISATIKNDGATSVPVSSFSDMDVVVRYDAAAQAPLRLTYTATDPSPGRPVD